eukprot:403363071
MQKQLLHIRHPLLIGYHAVAVEQEKPTIKFLVVEENLTPNSMTLRNLMDRIGSNQLLMQFFSDKIYLWRLIIQTLKAIEVLNQHGVSHYDINPNNIVIKFKDPDTITDIIHQFDIQIFDFLNIKELGEIAMNERKVPFNKIVTAYDPPEKISVGQDNITQNCDIWSLGVVILQLILILQEGADYMEGLTKLQLRDISYEGRITFIKEQVKDLAYRELLYKMLEDKSRRPSAAVLLQDESLLFISYLLEETDIDLGEINKNEKCLPALISCLNLTNKNKAVIAFLALMNLYGVMPKQVLQLLEQEHQYIAILELLFICLKEQNDSEFANLYSKGIDILNYFLLKEPRNPEIRSQYALGGIINLIMLAIDNQAIDVIQITETCGFLETIDEMAEQSLKFSEARYQFMSKTAQYYGIDNFIKSSSILNANDMIQVAKSMPLNQRCFEKDMFSQFFKGANVKIPYEMGMICQTCTPITASKRTAVCITCAHLCHKGHQLVPLGIEQMNCECNLLKHPHQCNATQALKIPECAKLCSDFNSLISKNSHQPQFIYENVLFQDINGLTNYIANDFETTTIVATEHICEVNSCNSNSVSESPSLQLEIKRDLAQDTQHLRSYGKQEIENPIFKNIDNFDSFRCQSDEIDELEEEEQKYQRSLAYYEVKINMGGFYDQLAIGITNNSSYSLTEFAGYHQHSIAYHADDGKVYVNGKSIVYASRYGSNDIVGCGVTKSGDVYFTLNGMILPLINIEMQGQIFPIISMRGKYTSVCVNYGHNEQFIFSHQNNMISNPIKDTILDSNLLISIVKDNELVQMIEEFYDSHISEKNQDRQNWLIKILVSKIKGTQRTIEMQQTKAGDTPYKDIFKDFSQLNTSKMKIENEAPTLNNMNYTNRTNESVINPQLQSMNDSQSEVLSRESYLNSPNKRNSGLSYQNKLKFTDQVKGKISIGQSIEIESRQKLLNGSACSRFGIRDKAKVVAMNSNNDQSSPRGSCSKNKNCIIF